MKRPSITARYAAREVPANEALALFAFEDASSMKELREAVVRMSGDKAPLLDGKGFAGKEGDTLVLTPSALGGHPLLIVGCGRPTGFSLERLRRGSATAVKLATQLQRPALSLRIPVLRLLDRELPKDKSAQWKTVSVAMTEGVLLGLYSFDKYRTPSPKPSLDSVTFCVDAKDAVDPLTQGIARGRILCEGTILARNLANAPANEVTPEVLATTTRTVGKTAGFSTRILGPTQIRALNMGGLLGVSQGSAHPPRFVIAEYGKRSAQRRTVVLVGKGITFDSGGISIKPSAGMAEMKMDMSGAAAVIGTMQTVSRLKLPVHLVGLIPVTENMPGGRAMKPGDIVKHLNGKTTEVDNTDAEGRLILADALSYASRYAPDAVIDLATLTGAVVVALGHHATGMLGNDEDLMQRLRESGERTYERVWQLPLFEEYDRHIKSDIADVKNVGGRWGGAITASAFLKNFIGDYRWVHLDIAGTAMIEDAGAYLPRGGTGVGVRLLTDFLERFSASPKSR